MQRLESLWGRDDNLTSAGTVTLNYSNLEVTNSGSNFAASDVGKVIRFGTRGGGSTYFGDAVIVKYTSATKVTIGSTAGLAGGAISGAEYYKSELPISSVGDHGWSNKHDTTAAYSAYKVAAAKGATGLGGINVGVHWKNLHLQVAEAHPDALVNGGANVSIAGIGTGSVAADNPSGIGSDTLYVVAPPGVAKHDTVDNVNAAGDKIKIASIGATTVSLASTIATAVTGGAKIMFNSDNVISLASTVGTAIVSGERLHFKRLSGGYDKQIYGIATDQSQDYDGVSTKYRTEGSGWVGVTTYIDCHGKLRVKKETLVAVGGDVGITTGSNGISYPTPVG